MSANPPKKKAKPSRAKRVVQKVREALVPPRPWTTRLAEKQVHPSTIQDLMNHADLSQPTRT